MEWANTVESILRCFNKMLWDKFYTEEVEFIFMLMSMVLILSPGCINSSQGEDLIIINTFWISYSYDWQESFPLQ